MGGKTQTIQWSPLSEKHRRYILNALRKRMSVAEGAIRSGKTIDHCIISAIYLETCPDKIHLASGSSIANAKLNIGDCNGFGLEYLFRGRCKWGKYKDNECLRIQTQTGEKIVIFAGGSKADSYKKILGNSYGLWFATEINEHYDSDDSRTSFIKVAFGRQAAAQKPLVLWDMNPSNPHAPIYTDYVDRYRDEGILGGYQYQHFTIHDNRAITPERVAEIESQYTKGSVWYRRDILGERCVAEGLIYTPFVEHEQDFYIEPSEVPLGNIGCICVGQDIGGTKSKHTFCATAITRDYRQIFVLMSEELKGSNISVEDVRVALERFCDKIEALYGHIDCIRVDSMEKAIINSERNNLRWNVLPSIKNEVNDRIRATDLMMTGRRIKIVKGANDSLIEALRSAVWDAKSPTDNRLDIPGQTNVCPLDAFEYSWENWIRQLTSF